MSYLSKEQVTHLGELLRTFFALPYSTDLDGKDAETLIRIVKDAVGAKSKRKELFDIVDGDTGYSVKTLFKATSAVRVDLQEQRFCDVEDVRRMRSDSNTAADQGALLLNYMLSRIKDQMAVRNLKHARSLILLKHWDKSRTKFSFRYWEEDFIGYVQDLADRNEKGEIEWIVQGAGLHARDRLRQASRRNSETDENVRLLRMHYKHNQIFTDHDIPKDADKIEFSVSGLSWGELSELIALAKAKT